MSAASTPEEAAVLASTTVSAAVVSSSSTSSSTSGGDDGDGETVNESLDDDRPYAESTKKAVQKIPLLTVRAGPRDADKWMQRLREEYTALIQVKTEYREDSLSRTNDEMGRTYLVKGKLLIQWENENKRERERIPDNAAVCACLYACST